MPDQAEPDQAGAHRLQSGEGRPRLEAILRSETRPRERPPIPAVLAVAVEVGVAVERVVWVGRHPALLLGLGAVGGAGDQEGAAGVLLEQGWQGETIM